MHNACMATKTISIDLVAYERLRQARQTTDESFSQVIRRANWGRPRKNCGDFLDQLRRHKSYLSTAIRLLQKAQAQDATPARRWN